MDVCDDFGNAFIGYSVKLEWKNITISYRGYIFRNTDGKISGTNKLGDACIPEEKTDSIEWNTPEVSGIWRSKRNPVSENVMLPDQSRFSWNCLQPLSGVNVGIRNGTTITGNGYAEKIALDVVPWKLPITTLYWGRFTSREHSVIWIHWAGCFPLTLVYANGVRFNEISFTDKEIHFPGGRIIFGDLHPIRTGTLSETVLKNLHVIRRLFPVRALSITENKWFCHATFVSKNDNRIQGQCIHEIVSFG